MSNTVIRIEHVYKKFRKGEVYNSLRDLLPALTGKMFTHGELSNQDKREFWAVQDLSFEVRHGEAFGIIGHNGAGKSTVLKMLSRIMKPTKGRMVVNGRLSALIEVSAGFHGDLTGRENIFLNGTILGMSKKEIQSKLDQIVAFSGIEEFIDTPVKHYSSGMYARLGFSVAAHVDPDVLIVDEVLSVGDYAFQQKCIERMQEVIHSGATVVFVSHNLKVVAEFCHRCLLLQKGRAVTIESPSNVIGTYLQKPGPTNGVDSPSGPVIISNVRIRNEHGDGMRFRAGDKAWVDIELRARQRCSKLSVTCYILDDKSGIIFDTSTDLLGLGTFNLDESETYRCTFELSLNLADGTYHPSVLIYRRDIQKVYDKWEPAGTIYVSSGGAVTGIAHCFPRVVWQGICESSGTDHVPVGPVTSARPN